MDAAKFFTLIRPSPFAGRLSQEAVDGINAIIGAFDVYGDGDVRKLAYILATAFHEADRFRTMREYASGQDYEGRTDLGNTQNGDGRRFRGRGFVQITGRRNYTDWSKRLGLDLVANPQLAEDRTIAARILVEGMMLGTFTGKGLPDYITAGSADYTNARRVVNGTDKASLIAGYAKQFEAALREAAYGSGEAVAPVIVVTQPEPAIPAAPVQEPAMPTPAPKSDLTPIEQSNKAVGAGTWAALASAIWTAIVAADVLPAAYTTPEFQAAVGGIIASVAAAIGAYRARDKRFQPEGAA